MMKTEQDQLSLAVYSLQRTGFRYGMHAFVTGCDEFSCTLGALLQHCGAASVTLGAKNSDEAAKVEQQGFSSYVYGHADNIATAKELTEGRLYDLVFETTGNSIAYDAFIDMLKRGGTAGLLARLDEAYTFYIKTAVRSQIRFVGIRTIDDQSVSVAKGLIEREWRGSK